MDSIVIIGGGQAAAFAASTLRKEGYEGRLAIISDENQVFYERPPLSKGILDGKEALENLYFFDQESIDKLNIEWHKPMRAIAIDRQAKVVKTDQGTALPYDKLIIATGSRPRVPNDQWLTFKNAHTLRTIDDALKLKSALTAGKRLAIIGGGWIGLEVAATARQLGLEVTLFERESRLCSRSVAAEVSAHLLTLHEAEGTTILLDAKEIEVTENEDGTLLIQSGDHAIEVDLLLIGAGAEIATELAVEAGLEVDGGIVVDLYGKSSDPDIYAAGDVAIHPLVGFTTQSWAHAQQQAEKVAKAIVGKKDEPYQEVPWIWSDQYHHNIQIMGFPIDEESQLVIREDDHKKCFIHLDNEQKVRSIVAFNEPKAIGVGRFWFRKGAPLDPEQLQNSEIDLMKLR